MIVLRTMTDTDASAHTGHHSAPKTTIPLPPIERAIRALVPSGRYAEITALFEARVPYSYIREWRRGRSKPPQWALDLCARRLAPYVELEASVRTAPSAPGRQINARNLMAYHARKKEKAAQGGPPPNDSE